MFSKLAAVVLAACVVATWASEADVAQLTDADFTTRVAEFETNLVMFYAPW